MAQVRVMYWKEIPVQVNAQDGDESVSVPLDPQFQEAVDSIAMFEGSAGSDEYLDGWDWCGFRAVEGGAEKAAHAAAARYNSGMPDDFVARLRDLHTNGQREGIPGAIDHWFDE